VATKIPAIVIVVACSVGIMGALPTTQPTYDAAIQEGQTAAQELINQGTSALAIALVDDKRIIWSQRFGLADRDTGQMPTDSTMFGIGSLSKMLATIAVMKLVDRGVVDLDTPLVTYLPTFRMAAAGYEKITVRMLLNHSSGFPGTDYRNAIIDSFGSGPPDALYVAAQGPARLHERLL
jgi:CubicO group peptidase (beta-lactamase class C family)